MLTDWILPDSWDAMVRAPQRKSTGAFPRLCSATPVDIDQSASECAGMHGLRSAAAKAKKSRDGGKFRLR